MKDKKYREAACTNQFRYMGSIIFCVGLFYLVMVIYGLIQKHFL
jgi:hypothetical protein